MNEPPFQTMDINASEIFENPLISYGINGSAGNTSILAVVVLITGLAANVTFLWSLLASDRRSRLCLFLINLAIADLLVCCFTIAMELGWRLTVVWVAGDFACRFLSVTKTLGLYLEAFVVLMMSVDRCYVVLWPMRIGGRRTKLLLTVAWVAASLFSFPQGIVFHVEHYPDLPEFTQCVSLNSFPTAAGAKAYVLFGILSMYAVPLLIIVVVSIILMFALRTSRSTELFHETSDNAGFLASSISSARSLELHGSSTREPPNAEKLALRPMRLRLNTGLQLHHSNTAIRKQARLRTLRFSLLILVAFILCYTPYAAMIWNAFVDFDEPPDENIYYQTEALLMLSLSFSTFMNPLIYGSYMFYSRKRWKNVIHYFTNSFHVTAI